MRHVNDMKVGDHICLFKDFSKTNWELNCIGSYETCSQRAVSVGGSHKGSSVMVVAIMAMAEPSLTLLWTSALGEKIKGV